VPAKGVLRRSWIRDRFLRGGGGERFGRGGANRWRGGVGGRDDMRLDEPLDLRFISSQPLYRGVEFDVGVGDGERAK
jgi:hypothetical protein